MKLVRVSPPSGDVVSLAEAKAHVRQKADFDDDKISRTVAYCTEELDGPDGILGRCLLTQQWELHLDRFPTGAIHVPLPPLQAVDSVKYYDGEGQDITLGAAEYYVDAASQPGVIVPVADRGWPQIDYWNCPWPGTQSRPDAVRVLFTAGYGTAADVPGPIKQAIELMVCDRYENREDTIVGTGATAIPHGAMSLITRYRVWEA